MVELADGSIFAKHYRIEALLGRGTMSSVYRATDVTSARVVALKVLEQSEHLEHAPHRFAQEASILRRIESDVVIRVLDSGVTEDGTAYSVLEHIDGRSLEDVLARRGSLEPKDVIALGLRLAAGLAAAHRAGIVHGDIKPANIFIPGEDLAAAKIGDFGLAESVQPRLGTTQAGVFLGTPSYMSPEQARGLGRTPATDVWMLGVTLYQCVYGRLPFEGPPAHDGTRAPLFAVLHQILTEPAAFPALPGGLENVLAVALHKAPEQRYATMAAFGDALGALERGSAPPRPVKRPSPEPPSRWQGSGSAGSGDPSFEDGVSNVAFSGTKRWSPAIWISLLCTFALVTAAVVTYVSAKIPPIRTHLKPRSRDQRLFRNGSRGGSCRRPPVAVHYSRRWRGSPSATSSGAVRGRDHGCATKRASFAPQRARGPCFRTPLPSPSTRSSPAWATLPWTSGASPSRSRSTTFIAPRPAPIVATRWPARSSLPIRFRSGS